jgi:hypothetical protein
MNAMQYDGSLLLVALLAGLVAQQFYSIYLIQTEKPSDSQQAINSSKTIFTYLYLTKPKKLN